MTDTVMEMAMPADGEEPQAAEPVRAGAGKYLTFKLGAEEYGLEILRVTTIIGLMDITAVPDTPHYVRGVMNLRGKVIPVVEMRTKFSLPTIEDTKETCVIVVEVREGDHSTSMGILVDSVSEVLDIPAEAIEETPSFAGGATATEYILGMAKIDEDVKMLLDIDRVLVDGDLVLA